MDGWINKGMRIFLTYWEIVDAFLLTFLKNSFRYNIKCQAE